MIVVMDQNETGEDGFLLNFEDIKEFTCHSMKCVRIRQQRGNLRSYVSKRQKLKSDAIYEEFVK